MRAKRTACALLPCLSERTGAGGEIARQCLDELAHLRPRDAEVAVAPVALDAEQAARDELAEMGAGGGSGHAGLVGEHARG